MICVSQVPSTPIQTGTRPGLTGVFLILYDKDAESCPLEGRQRAHPDLLPSEPNSTATAGNQPMGKHLSVRKDFPHPTVTSLGPVELDKRWNPLSSVSRETCSAKLKEKREE